MVMSIRQLQEDFAPKNGLRIRFVNASDEQTFRSWIYRSRPGSTLGSSDPRRGPAGFPRGTRADGWSEPPALHRRGRGRGPRRRRRPGATGVATLQQRPYPDHRPDHREGHAPRALATRPAARPTLMPRAPGAANILRQLIKSWEIRLGVGAGNRFGIPIAVVLSKVDRVDLGLGPDPARSYRSRQAAMEEAARDWRESGGTSTNTGWRTSWRLVESRFSKVGYFGMSALGRTPTSSDPNPFSSRGALAPLIWLACHTGVLGTRRRGGTLSMGRATPHPSRPRCVRARTGC